MSTLAADLRGLVFAAGWTVAVVGSLLSCTAAPATPTLAPAEPTPTSAAAGPPGQDVDTPFGRMREIHSDRASASILYPAAWSVGDISDEERAGHFILMAFGGRGEITVSDPSIRDLGLLGVGDDHELVAGFLAQQLIEAWQSLDPTTVVVGTETVQAARGTALNVRFVIDGGTREFLRLVYVTPDLNSLQVTFNWRPARDGDSSALAAFVTSGSLRLDAP